MKASGQIILNPRALIGQALIGRRAEALAEVMMITDADWWMLIGPILSFLDDLW